MLRVLQNRELKKIFGPKRVEITWGWKKLDNEELHDLHSSLSRVVRWARHVAHTVENRNTSGFLWENLKEGDSLEELGIDGLKILKSDPKDIIWENMKRIHLA